MQNTSNNIKASLYIDDFQQMSSVNRDKCMTIQTYEYTLNKSRKQNGEPHAGACAGSMLTFTLKVGSRDAMNVFYSRLKEFSTSSFSVIFDALFNEVDIMRDYSSAMVVNGYIVNVDECFNEEDMSEDKQLTLKVNILVNGITYVGSGRNIVYNL